jgi:hypothetical protein
MESNDGVTIMSVGGPVWWDGGSFNKYNYYLTAWELLINFIRIWITRGTKLGYLKEGSGD